MKLVRSLRFLPAIAALSLSSCTGINIATSANPNLNTNPATEYANYEAVIYRGGGIYHKNSTAGQLGDASALRSGRSCSKSALWLFAWGDSSIETAKRNGDIRRIASIEHESLGIFGFIYHRHCTILTGE